MTIPDTIYDTINDNWGSGGYAGDAPAIGTTEIQKSIDLYTANVVEVRAFTLRERGEQKNDVFVNRHYTMDVYISTKTSAAQLTLLYDEVEYLLRNTAMTGIQIEYINKDWSVSQWEQGRHSVVLHVAIVALLSDGAVTSAAGVTASMQALLMYGSANAAYIPCQFWGSTTAAKVVGQSTYLSNVDATDIGLLFELPLPTTMGTLKLYISDLVIGLRDADASDYLDQAIVLGVTTAFGQPELLNDGTDYTAPAVITYTLAAVDCSGYQDIKVQVLLVCTTAGEVDISFVKLKCYYDT